MTSTDVVVVGGGLIGSAIAWRLSQKKLRVLVLEKAEPGAEASSAAAGILSPQAEADSETPFFKLQVASRNLYPQFARELLEATGLDVELRLDGVVFVAESEADLEELDTRLAWQARAGLRVERLSPEAVRELEPRVRDGIRGGALFPEDGQVENRRLTRAAVLAASAAGARFENGNPVRRVLVERSKVTGVEAASGTIRSDAVVLAAGAWAGEALGLPFAIPVSPARGEMVAVESATGPSRVLYSHRVYVVPRRDGRILLGATLERLGFDKRVKAKAVAQLLAAGLDLIPALEEAGFHSAWAGLRPCAPDELPILGASPVEGLTLATAHFRNGILLAPLTAQATADIVATGEAGWDLTPFSVGRFDSSER